VSLHTVAAFYKFVDLTDLSALQHILKQFCKDQDILGTLLLATEGINGTVAGPAKGIKALIAFLRADTRFAELECKYSYSEQMPFQKMKVLIKNEIVHLGVPSIRPHQATGISVAPEQWDRLISDPEVCLIDTRNHYETEQGTFKGASDPKTKTFREFPNYVARTLDPTQHKKIALFCTGGIRCEKASAYLLQQGFENVYQLQGGILKYLEKISPDNSTWQGKCFIFDDRLVLDKDFIIPGEL